MLFKLSTDKSVNETAAALQAAAIANRFGVMQLHNLRETMTKKGMNYEEGGKTILTTLKPIALLAMFNVPQLQGVAQDVEKSILPIVKEGGHGRISLVSVHNSTSGQFSPILG